MEGTPRGGVGERNGGSHQAVVVLKPVGSHLIVRPLPTSPVVVVVVVVVRFAQVVLNGQFLHPAADWLLTAFSQAASNQSASHRRAAQVHLFPDRVVECISRVIKRNG